MLRALYFEMGILLCSDYLVGEFLLLSDESSSFMSHKEAHKTL